MSYPQTTTSRYMTLGALPFIVLSIGAWLSPPDLLSAIYLTFTSYSVVIFGFMVGAIWGAKLLQGSSKSLDEDNLELSSKSLSLSILASLFSMVALAIGGAPAATMMLVAYLALPHLEQYAHIEWPSTYFEMRSKINRTVVASHIVILVHMIQPH